MKELIKLIFDAAAVVYILLIVAKFLIYKEQPQLMDIFIISIYNFNKLNKQSN
jgi:hypothetical protein